MIGSYSNFNSLVYLLVIFFILKIFTYYIEIIDSEILTSS